VDSRFRGNDGWLGLRLARGPSTTARPCPEPATAGEGMAVFPPIAVWTKNCRVANNVMSILLDRAVKATARSRENWPSVLVRGAGSFGGQVPSHIYPTPTYRGRPCTIWYRAGSSGNQAPAYAGVTTKGAAARGDRADTRSAATTDARVPPCRGLLNFPPLRPHGKAGIGDALVALTFRSAILLFSYCADLKVGATSSADLPILSGQVPVGATSSWVQRGPRPRGAHSAGV